MTIHVPGEDLGRPEEATPAEEPAAEEAAQPKQPGPSGEEAPKPKKKTRRGSRGGKRRKKPAAASQNGAEAPAEPAPAAEETSSSNGEFEYVPMSEWADELETGR